jgi:hypothetical protein
MDGASAMNLKDFRNELPLGDDDFRAIRRSVLQQIERPSSHWLGTFLRASLVAAALVLLLVRPTEETVPERPSRPVVESPTIPAPPSPSTTRRLADSPPRVATHHRTPPRRRPIRHQPSPLEWAATPLRIELHTSNPDIRILWITNPTGETR